MKERTCQTETVMPIINKGLIETYTYFILFNPFWLSQTRLLKYIMLNSHVTRARDQISIYIFNLSVIYILWLFYNKSWNIIITSFIKKKRNYNMYASCALTLMCSFYMYIYIYTLRFAYLFDIKETLVSLICYIGINTLIKNMAKAFIVKEHRWKVDDESTWISSATLCRRNEKRLHTKEIRHLWASFRGIAR